jgi:hypothetical protein
MIAQCHRDAPGRDVGSASCLARLGSAGKVATSRIFLVR